MRRDDKVEEIIEAARRQVAEGGPAALSIAGISRDLGVAQNAIYWYFPSRDHLLVAVARRMMEDVAARKPSSAHSVSDRAVWIVNRLADFYPVAMMLQERAEASEVAREFRDDLEQLLRGMVVNLVAPHVRTRDVEVAADAVWATVEGTLMRKLPRRRREAVLRFTLRQLLGSGADAPHP
jgi:TetR/AcrR family transcriptional regulator, cholesterol catabolism regulator